jgi:hypothetical protein
VGPHRLVPGDGRQARPWQALGLGTPYRVLIKEKVKRPSMKYVREYITGRELAV